jgi:hypothetical protein
LFEWTAQADSHSDMTSIEHVDRAKLLAMVVDLGDILLVALTLDDVEYQWRGTDGHSIRC